MKALLALIRAAFGLGGPPPGIGVSPAPVRENLMAPPPAPVPPAESAAKKKTLAAVIGSVSAAAALFVMVPAEESGRKVEATAQNDGTVTVKHVSGNQHLKAYRDIVGVVTICDGDTKNVKMGQVATQAECTARLERQLIAHAEPIIKCVPGLKGRTNQVVASVSLAYNIGTAGFCKSSVARRFNAGQWKSGCDAFLMWNKAGGRVIRGLDNRRKRERALCLQGL